MPETAAQTHRSSAVEARRQLLTGQLESDSATLAALQGELKSATGVDKNRLLWMIKDQTASVENARTNLESFEKPIVLPKLRLTKIGVSFHSDNKQIDAVVWVNNDGIFPVLGSFELDLSVAFYTYGQDPPLLEDLAFQTQTPDSTDIQPGGTNPFVFPNIPFVTKPGSSSAIYTFDALLFAGPDGVVGDQTMHVQYSLKPLLVPRPIVAVLPVEASTF
jgi:hypothetical protein